MKIHQSEIVSNTDIIKNYKKQRDKAEELGKIIVFKNNRPDAVLFSITEYEKIAEIQEAFEALNEDEITHVIDFVRKERTKAILLTDIGQSLKKE
jgi:hypothetical protein